MRDTKPKKRLSLQLLLLNPSDTSSHHMEKTSDLPEADDKGLQDPPTQTWNKPAINALRLLATFISFVIIGANDGLYNP